MARRTGKRAPRHQCQKNIVPDAGKWEVRMDSLGPDLEGFGGALGRAVAGSAPGGRTGPDVTRWS